MSFSFSVMWLRALAFLLLVTGAKSACYYVNQTYDPNSWPVIYILNNYDEATGNPKSGTCTLYIDSNNTALGFGNFAVSDSTSQSGWTVTVQDTELHSFSGTKDPAFKNFQSYSTTSSKITINITTVSDSVQFLATMKAVPIGSVITTSPVPTTVPYTPSNGLIYNPATIAADIAFAVDSYASATKDRSQIVYMVANLLSLTNDLTNTVSSRAAVTSLNAMAGSYGPYGQSWSFANADELNLALNSVPKNMPAQSKWNASLIEMSQHLFSIDGVLPSRKNAQRVIMVVYTQDPADAEVIMQGSLIDTFKNYDIKPVFVLYKGDASSEFFAYLQENFVAFQITDKTLSDTYSILAQSIDNGVKLCPDKNIKNPLELPSNEQFTYKIPENYKGSTTNDAAWNTDSQTARYCNLYDVTYNFTTTDRYVCFKVYYELEIEKDFLRFYSGSFYNELVSLTGMDVSGSIFAIPNPSSDYGIVLARFTTNANQVYGGFTFTVMSSPTSDCTNFSG